MKNRFHFLSFIYTSLWALIWLLIACAAVSCRQSDRTYRIGVSQCSSDDWRSKMNDEIMREAMFHPNVEVEILSAHDDNRRQIEDIRYFADNDFDIILAAPNEAEAITPVIDEVYASGIPVVIFDRDISSQSYTARMATDNRQIGASAATYALAMPGLAHKSTPTAIELRGLDGSSPADMRRLGFDSVFTGAGGRIAASASGGWNYDSALVVADSLLALHPDVDLIYAHNDRMAIGASEAAAARGLDSIRIIGIDASPSIGLRAVADSVIDATFLYPTEGHRIIRTAIAILEGRDYDRENILPTSSAVDRSNADILLLQDRTLQEETRKMNELKRSIDSYWSQHSAQTSLFYASIAILILLASVLFSVLRAYWQRRRFEASLKDKNAQLEQESRHLAELNSKLEEATKAKLAFYTNVSHDLRTPLTLIAEPISQLSSAPNIDPSQKSLLRIARKNVLVLRRLINQILDFRKYENGISNINMVETDFTAAVADWVDAFAEAARAHHIKLRHDAPEDQRICMAIDPEKMERVFFNLIANAIKYTPANGTVTVAYSTDGETLTATVTDTGIGIEASEQDLIFERFHTVDKVHPNGSGIGLSLVRAFVELHGGTVEVESTPGKGSTFKICIPVRHVEGEASVATPLIAAADIEAELTPASIADVMTAETPGECTSEDNPKPTLLIIDDSADMRALVASVMGTEYNIYQASDGQDGLAKAARLIPDLVICDVMMPVMDGFECCRRIKAEVSTSHVPVLLLTACALDRQRADGYDAGADGYLSKPFDAELLRSRCASLIANRRRIIDVLRSSNPLTPLPTAKAENHSKPVAVTGAPDVDNEFYNRFLEIFTANISNPDLSMESIASELGLGHSQFYRKIKALTNYTPVELVRMLRLCEARRLLTSTDKTVSEIAYAVGFSSAAYFTKCYRQAYGETPSTLRDKLGI